MDQHLKAISKTLSYLGRRHGVWRAFSDWVAMMACSISNAVDRSQFEQREAEYLKIIKAYTADEVRQMAQMMGSLTLSLEAHHDALGALYMHMELGNRGTGQFFTPYHLSSLMARINMCAAEEHIQRNGFVRVYEPACGAGGMLIATAEAMLEAGINYQQTMHATAVDIDLTAVHMTYVQLSLLHLPAVVVHGNSLTMQEWSRWFTPAHVLGAWQGKLKRGYAISAMRELLAESEAEHRVGATVDQQHERVSSTQSEVRRSRGEQLVLF